MKIKGIDLYKKVLEKDETILNKKFRSQEFGIIKIGDEWGDNADEFGMEVGNEVSFLYDKSLYEINKIMLSEWEEVVEPVTWQEAIEARMNGKEVYFMYEEDRYELYSDVLGVCRINNESTRINSDEEELRYEMLQNGQWFIED